LTGWQNAYWDTDFGGTLDATMSPSNTCDQNNDGAMNVVDVQLVVNQALGVTPCTTGDLQQNSRCDVLDVQRAVNAVLTGVCNVGP
jgi:hypothetical protein